MCKLRIIWVVFMFVVYFEHVDLCERPDQLSHRCRASFWRAVVYTSIATARRARPDSVLLLHEFRNLLSACK